MFHAKYISYFYLVKYDPHTTGFFERLAPVTLGGCVLNLEFKTKTNL